MLIQQLSETSLTVNYQNNCFLNINDYSIKSWVHTCLPFECLEAGVGRLYNSNFMQTCTVSSGPQLAVFELNNVTTKPAPAQVRRLGVSLKCRWL